MILTSAGRGVTSYRSADNTSADAVESPRGITVSFKYRRHYQILGIIDNRPGINNITIISVSLEIVNNHRSQHRDSLQELDVTIPPLRYINTVIGHKVMISMTEITTQHNKNEYWPSREWVRGPLPGQASQGSQLKAVIVDYRILISRFHDSRIRITNTVIP